ncbi:FHA domain-containing protein [Microbacterium sp. W1N]|uniref:FHA domain-containing protein n=1 Tax=Microbacterium festucae TaxID=2977531 RepID=UPI0021C24437|nr:FHA domain-containing protein [Microbacterium festucae]MCT9819105.1 FHA domain-containing protein [Microbacterium festucae]
MTTSVMSSTLDGSLTLVTVLLSTAIGIALYIWLALALSAMFRKMGEASWKGWVPLLNLATLLRWGGFSPWMVLLVFVPVVGLLVVWVLLIVSAHRINQGYGYGPGMTVLAALLHVVWASILGFGPAPWRGVRPAGDAPPAGRTPDADAAPTAARLVDIPPVVAPRVAAATAAGSLATPTSPAAPVDLSTPTAAAAPAAPAAPARTAAPVTGASSAPQAWAPPAPGAAPQQASPQHEIPDAAAPAPAATPAPAAEPDIAGWPSEVDDVSAVSPSPFPPSSASVSGARHVPAPAPADEVISFVPGRRLGDEADRTPAAPAAAPAAAASAAPPAPARTSSVPASEVPPAAAAPASPAPAAATPPAPAAAEPAPAEPAPAEQPVADAPPATRAATRARWSGLDPDAFPELSGEVSAVVGSPAAGAPRSALGAVSAQQRREAELADDADAGDDEVDQTVMVRRKLPTWRLIPASGAPVAITGDVAILGRRPAADPGFPSAQLVAVEDLARTVSKTHARIELRGERWLITDLGSTNGVLVRTLMGDEVEIEPGTELAAGERFFLGDEEFRLLHD